jgi:hypothetical protein
VVHGTSKEIAMKICQAGFANLSSLDDGYYGKGIYFSTSAMYCIPYFLKRKNPALLICFLTPGNPYPVIEQVRAYNSLLGKALKSKYHSHFVAVNKEGMVVPEEDIGNVRVYDEIVIPQENQVVPAYLLCFSNANVAKIIEKFNREVPPSVFANVEADAAESFQNYTNVYSIQARDGNSDLSSQQFQNNTNTPIFDRTDSNPEKGLSIQSRFPLSKQPTQSEQSIKSRQSKFTQSSEPTQPEQSRQSKITQFSEPTQPEHSIQSRQSKTDQSESTDKHKSTRTSKKTHQSESNRKPISKTSNDDYYVELDG